MTNSQQTALANLRGLGFTARQAEFLYLVGTNTGIFTAAHFRTYTGTAAGQTTATLITKLTEMRYISRALTDTKFQLIRLTSKEFYRSILTPDSRLRRPMSASLVRQRLQYLDFIVNNPIHDFYGSEDDKVSFFCNQFNAPLSSLPIARYHSRKSDDTTVRYFPDRFPVFSAIDDDGSTRPGIAYGEDPRSRFDLFRGFLHAHRALFAVLPNMMLVYISPNSRRREMANREVTTRLSATNDVITEHLIRYFTLRQRIENNDSRSFTRADFQLWNDLHKQFGTPQYEQVYEQYQQQISLAAVPRACSISSIRVEFFEPYTALPGT